MTSHIELRGLVVLARVGVLPFEQEQDQPVELDVDLTVDVAAGDTDDLADTVDYGAVCGLVEQTIQAAPVALLERLVSLVADAVLAFDARIVEVDVVARKLRPPVPQQLATSGVRVVRGRA